MLDGARNSHRNIELGTHHPPGLTDLVGGRPPAVVGDRSGRADRGVAEGGGEIFHQLEVLRRAEAPAAAHDDRRLAQIERRTGLLRQVGHHHPRGRRIEGGRRGFHTRGARLLRRLARAGHRQLRSSAGVPARRRVTITLPVYAGCCASTASPESSKPVTSDAIATPSRAATRGARSRPCAEAEKNAAR
jgi:hypothetical protein